MSSGDILTYIEMKFLIRCFALAALQIGLLSCADLSCNPVDRIRARLFELAKDSFHAENRFASEVDITTLKDHSLTLRLMLSDVQRNRYVEEMKPVLNKLRSECTSDEEFIAHVESVVRKAGCSGAIIAAVSAIFPGDRFEFSRDVTTRFNPDYSYSKHLIDVWSMFGERRIESQAK